MNSKKLKRGDIVEVEWFDTHSLERVMIDEILDLDDPDKTVAYGVVIKNGSRYLTVASELCLDPDSDGNWIEQIPHGAILKTRILGKRKLATWSGD